MSIITATIPNFEFPKYFSIKRASIISKIVPSILLYSNLRRCTYSQSGI